MAVGYIDLINSNNSISSSDIVLKYLLLKCVTILYSNKSFRIIKFLTPNNLAIYVDGFLFVIYWSYKKLWSWSNFVISSPYKLF